MSYSLTKSLTKRSKKWPQVRENVRAACPKNMLQSMFFQARSWYLYSGIFILPRAAYWARKKLPSSSPGQEDFLSGQLSFKLYTCDAWAIVQVSYSLTKSLTKRSKKWPQVRENVRAACPKNMLQSMFFQARSWYLYSELLCQT